MAKEYKFLNDVYTFNVEDRINELASQGWVVKSFNVSYKGEQNDDETCFVLMEYDDSEDYLEAIYERLDSVSDKLSSIRERMGSFDDSDILKSLSSIKNTLEFIEGNTSQ